ncbi:hypothetical protein F4703DRAFT_1898961 [Phycomyces blakesleeanus]
MRLNFFRSKSDLSVNQVVVEPTNGCPTDAVPTASRQRRQRSSTEPCHTRRSRSNTLDNLMDIFQETSPSTSTPQNIDYSLDHSLNQSFNSPSEYYNHQQPQQQSQQQSQQEQLIENHISFPSVASRANSAQIYPKSTLNTRFLSKSKRSVASWISKTHNDNSTTWPNYQQKPQSRYQNSTPDNIVVQSDSSHTTLQIGSCEPPTALFGCYSPDGKTRHHQQHQAQHKAQQQNESNIRCLSVAHDSFVPSALLTSQKERPKLTPAQKQRRKTTVFETTLLVAPDFIEEEPDNMDDNIDGGNSNNNEDDDDEWTCCEPSTTANSAKISDMLELMERETQRLRQCVNKERDQYFMCLQDKQDTLDCLRMAEQEIKCLKRKISIGKFIGFTGTFGRHQQLLTNKDQNNYDYEYEYEHHPILQQKKLYKRRHSVAHLSYDSPVHHHTQFDNEEYIYPTDPLPNLHTNPMPIERKIHILLEEIDAMQTDEVNMEKKYQRLTNKKHQLEYQVKQQDDTINQLRHELEIARLNFS